jgi:hypothetical protein
MNQKACPCALQPVYAECVAVRFEYVSAALAAACRSCHLPTRHSHLSLLHMPAAAACSVYALRDVSPVFAGDRQER